MSKTYAQVIRILADGDWHAADELESVTCFPEHWVRELRHDGHDVTTDAVGRPLVRLQTEGDAGSPRPGPG
jgi:hypothetical protein